MNKGKVWLVGAGPSDFGLLTIKALEALKNADTVIYDRLVGDSILSVLKKDAELIDVGKKSGYHSVPQNEINNIILEKALSGKNVVRLKGGDPFLFGRGGEEIELLHENNVLYEIVPGITSALSVPAYCGIPVTHREYVSSVHIITGHFKENQKNNIDFKALTALNGTLIFMMSVKSLNYICSGLIEAGMNEDMPVAVIENGTSSRQRNFVSDIKNITYVAEKNNIKSPSVFIVGNVCKLNKKFHWFDKLPLYKRKIAVTSPLTYDSDFIKELKTLGAEVLILPTIEIKEIENNYDFIQALKNIYTYDCILFTSKVSVNIFFDNLIKHKIDLRKLYNIKIGAVGKATAELLQQKGVFADFIPEMNYGINLGYEALKYLKKGNKVLFPCSKIRDNNIIEVLKANNIIVDDVSVYDTVFNKNTALNIAEKTKNNDIDYFVFTSASCVKGFYEMCGDIDYSNVNALCIGDKTAFEAEKFNMNIFKSKETTYKSIVDLILNLEEN